jgi:hypothetical protein
MRIIDVRPHCFISFVWLAEHFGHDGSNEVIDDEVSKH